MPARTDLAIIGGGPAGATLAALAAARGRDVVLLEKSRHPRFHIGESLLPANLDIFEQLGVLDRIHASGVYKPGADFQDAAPDSVRRAIRFDRALRPRREHAYHVLRSELDQLLFEHAARAGAHALSGARVQDVRFRPGTETMLTVQTPAGVRALSARLVVDASGRNTVIGRKLKLQRRNRQHATAALYAHFHNVPRNEDDEAGNISIYWFDQGWIWMIPLPRGVMSIGAVCNPDYLRQRDNSPDAFLLATLRNARVVPG